MYGVHQSNPFTQVLLYHFIPLVKAIFISQ